MVTHSSILFFLSNRMPKALLKKNGAPGVEPKPNNTPLDGHRFRCSTRFKIRLKRGCI
jgi:hypothetical protein